MASNKTPNLGMDVWAETDYFKRAELNSNFGKLDTNLGILSEVKIHIENFLREGSETDDTARVLRAINVAPEHATLVFKQNKTYNIKSLTITKALTIDLNGANFVVDPTTGSNGISGSPFIFFQGTKGTAYPLANCTQYSPTITLSTIGNASNFSIGDYVLIEDNKVVLDWTNTANTGYTGRSEVNYIKAIDTTTGILTLNSPIEWAYDTSPKISKLTMITNPTIVGNGATISEVNPGSEYTLNEDVLPHIFSFRYCVNPRVTHFSVSGWQLEICNFKNCVNPQVEKGYAEKPFRPDAGGHGYFARFDRCSGGSVNRSTGKGVRHMADYVMSYDASSSFNVTYGCKYGAYMMHGLGSKRISSTNDTAIGCEIGWSMGNSVFNADYDFDIINPKFIGDAGVSFQMMTYSKRMRILNPVVQTSYRLASVTTGADGFSIQGGAADIKDGSTLWETVLVRPEMSSGDTFKADPKNVSIRGMNINGRVYVYYKGVGSFVFKNNEVVSTNNTATCVYIDPTKTPQDLEITENKFLGVFDRAISTAGAPTRQYIISRNITSGHVSTPIKIYMSANLSMFENYLAGASDFDYIGDIDAAVLGGALIFGNTPNYRDNVNILKTNNVLTNNIDLVNTGSSAKAISIYSGTKASKSSRWIIRGSTEDVNANGTDLEIVARNNDGTNKGTPLMVRRSDMAVFMDKAPVIFAGTWDKPMWFGSNRVWFDSTGKMRTKATAPTSETDGTVVGSQS